MRKHSKCDYLLKENIRNEIDVLNAFVINKIITIIK